MTLGGLLKHLAYVEDDWFGRWLHGQRPERPVGRGRLGRRPRLGVALRRRRHPGRAAHALGGGGGRAPRPAPRTRWPPAVSTSSARRTWPDGRSPSLRWILCHMIEEYARHNGHADLLREAVDGEMGE